MIIKKRNIIKKYISRYNLQNTEYSFLPSLENGRDYIEWLYFDYKNYRYCLTCKYILTQRNKHLFCLSKIDTYGKEEIIYRTFFEKKY